MAQTCHGEPSVLCERPDRTFTTYTYQRKASVSEALFANTSRQKHRCERSTELSIWLTVAPLLLRLLAFGRILVQPVPLLGVVPGKL